MILLFVPAVCQKYSTQLLDKEQALAPSTEQQRNLSMIVHQPIN